MTYACSASFFFFLCLGLLCAALTLTLGSLPLEQVFEGVKGRFWGLHSQWNPLLDERLPRLLVLSASGASLAISGAVMQSLLQNPLATPGVLGVSAGSSLATLLLFMSGLQQWSFWILPLTTCLGAWAVLLLIICLWSHLSHKSFGSLLLIGISITTVLLAIQSALLYAHKDNWPLMTAIVELEAGSSCDRCWTHVHMQMPLTLIGLACCCRYSRELNLLALGEEEALHLGVEVDKVRWRLILAVGALCGGTAAAIGNLPFYGLILPNLLRSLYGSNHRFLLPLCICAGASLLLFLDLLLRSMQWHYLTIGNLSAFLGAFFFLHLLYRHHIKHPG